MLRRALILLLLAHVASAQPAPQPAPPGPPVTGDRSDAKALMQSGVKLLEAHDYLGALAIFKEAYQRFPSSKILLNIGTTLKLLGRKADAANVYQRYLDARDTDTTRHVEVLAVLAELDQAVGRVSVTVTPADAEIQVGDEWWPAAEAKVVRVEPGATTIRARHTGYQPGEKPVEVTAGGRAAVTIELAAIPSPVVKPVIVTVHDDVQAAVQPEGPRSRLGAFAMAHVSVVPKVGSAWLLGATFDVTEQLSIEGAAILGPGLVSSGMTGYPAAPPKLGGYVGASFAFMTGQLRPRASVGMPIFVSDGARFNVRAAGGVEYAASRHLGILVEVGLEDALNPPNDIRTIAVVPAIAAIGRL